MNMELLKEELKILKLKKTMYILFLISSIIISLICILCNNIILLLIDITTLIILSIIISKINTKIDKKENEILKIKKQIENEQHKEKMNIENKKFEIYKKEHQIEDKTPKNKYHIKTKTITDNEKYFLDVIKKHFGKDYEIRPQVPLSNIIEKEKDFDKQYQNELNRIIDIGIFDKETSYPLLLIEINDSTHKRKDRQVRDSKVKSICEQAGIKLIAFWTEYSNTEEYIFNRVNTNLRDSN